MTPSVTQDAVSKRSKSADTELTLRGVTLNRGDQKVLDALDLSFAAGSCTAVLGPNGAGKSSLLALLAGDLKPSGGRVRLSGRAPSGMGPMELAYRRAILVQRHELTHPFTVDRVIELGNSHASQAQRGMILAELGIEGLANRIYTELSGGEQRLVQCARVLLQCETMVPPGWLLLDEPESNLDLGVVTRVMSAARKRADKGMGVVAALHDLELASRWADQVVVLDRGRIGALGPPADALTSAVISGTWETPVHVEADVHGGVRIRPLAATPPRGPVTT